VKPCSVCGKKSIYFQRHSNRHLCRKHFIHDFERRVKYAVKKYNMIERNNRIAIALSGGKDSTALTFALKKLYGKRRDVEFFAITVDEGIAGYRPPTVEIAKKITSNLEMEHIVVSFRDEFGMELDEIVRKGKKKPCTYCGVFRKYLLNRTAREMGATKLATGHNLDDETQTILLNFLQGDIERLARLIPQRVQEDLIMRIKPFREVYEKEVVLYCLLNDIDVDMEECPYSQFPVRAAVRDFLYDFENRYPGRKYSVMRSFEALQDCFKAIFPQKDLTRCRICGEPTPKDMCQTCILKRELGLIDID
jgi:uncharacterized protein (TIGR00269 family)